MADIEDDEEVDPGITVVHSQCQTCAHRHKTTMTTCEAFPEGIPLIIIIGEYDHTNPYMEDGVTLDGGIRYEPDEP